MLTLLTGVPGIGKTSTCAHLEEQWPTRYKHLPFGAFIRQVLQKAAVTERDLRLRPTALVSPAVISEATELLRQAVAELPLRVMGLLDSHAVSQDDYGYVSTPDGPEYFRHLQYAAIVNLHTGPAEVLRRSQQCSTGRRAGSVEEVELHATLQLAVSSGYAMANACPLYVVRADRNLQDVAATVHQLLTRVGERA